MKKPELKNELKDPNSFNISDICKLISLIVSAFFVLYISPATAQDFTTPTGLPADINAGTLPVDVLDEYNSYPGATGTAGAPQQQGVIYPYDPKYRGLGPDTQTLYGDDRMQAAARILQQNSSTSGQTAQQGVINSYDPKYRPLQFPPDDPRIKRVFSRTGYTLHFVRPATVSPKEAVLRLSQPALISGCYTVANPEPEIIVNGPVMAIKIDAPKVAMIEPPRNAPHYQCPRASQAAFVDIALDPKQLESQGIKYLRFSNTFGQDRYKIEGHDSYLELVPETDMLFKANPHIQKLEPLRHWFYPENTVIFSAPTAVNDDVSDQIRDYAVRRGLAPLETKMKGFTQPAYQPNADTNTLYFYDEDGRFASQLLTNQTTPIGKINQDGRWYGNTGPSTVRRQIQVVAKRPGFLE